MTGQKCQLSSSLIGRVVDLVGDGVQARFYWREDRNTVIISICDVDFQYSFEYLGVKERLVITPLTDICYVTLSQVLSSCILLLCGQPSLSMCRVLAPFAWLRLQFHADASGSVQCCRR